MTKVFAFRCFWIVQLLWLFFFSCAGVMAADIPVKEATLEFNFRPVLTFRTLSAGATPEVRVERALARLHKLTPDQMEQPIEQTPFVDGMKGIGLRIGDVILFNVLAGDLDPEEKLSLEEASLRAAAVVSEALRSEAELRQPALLIKGLVRSLIVSTMAFVLLWLVFRATRFRVDRLQNVIERE